MSHCYGTLTPNSDNFHKAAITGSQHLHGPLWLFLPISVKSQQQRHHLLQATRIVRGDLYLTPSFLPPRLQNTPTCVAYCQGGNNPSGRVNVESSEERKKCECSYTPNTVLAI